MHTLRRFLFPLMALAAFPIGRFHELSGMGQSVAAMSNQTPALSTPAGYAFSIWGLIFVLLAGFALAQAWAPARHAPWAQRLGWPLTLSLLAGNAWMLAATLLGNGYTLLILIGLMAAAALVALGRAYALATTLAANGAGQPTTFVRYVILPVVGLLAGWLSIAFFLNLSGVIQLKAGIPMGGFVPSLITLSAAAMAGAWVLGRLLRVRPLTYAYVGALHWGLVGVIVANAQPGMLVNGSAHGLLATTVAGWAVMLLLLALHKAN